MKLREFHDALLAGQTLVFRTTKRGGPYYARQDTVHTFLPRESVYHPYRVKSSDTSYDAEGNAVGHGGGNDTEHDLGKLLLRYPDIFGDPGLAVEPARDRNEP